jgi:hypothetical protein
MSPIQCALCYVIDEQDRICRVSGPWNDFALDNRPQNAPERLMAEQVIGLSLQQFVQDEATRMLVSSVVNSVRLLGKDRQVDYRCDSPEEKRFMRMRVSLQGNGKVKLCHELLSSEPMAESFATEAVAREQAHHNRCSLCNRVEIKGVWLEPDDQVLQALPQPCPVYHGICPICRERVMLG